MEGDGLYGVVLETILPQQRCVENPNVTVPKEGNAFALKLGPYVFPPIHLLLEKSKRNATGGGWQTAPRDLLPEQLALPATCDGMATARITAKATYHD